jgi:nucleoside-diphosphate-sugar epimerase
MTFLCTIIESNCNAINTKPIILRCSIDIFTKSVACDVSKSKQVLCFEAKISPEAGIPKSIDYYLENGMLNK